VTDEATYRHKSRDKIRVPIILNFIFLDNDQDEKRFWKELWEEFPEFSLILMFACMQYVFVNILPTNMNFVTCSKDVLPLYTNYF